MRYEEALRIAEERDRTLRAAFNRFDLDASGTIDMEEILALLDHLNLLDNLQSEPVAFAIDMFHAYDANDDGVLDFEEFKKLHNAAKDDAAGRAAAPARPSISRTVSGLSAEQLAARKAHKEERARAKAEEAERIRQENRALKERLASRAAEGGADAKALDAMVAREPGAACDRMDATAQPVAPLTAALAYGLAALGARLVIGAWGMLRVKG